MGTADYLKHRQQSIQNAVDNDQLYQYAQQNAQLQRSKKKYYFSIVIFKNNLNFTEIPKRFLSFFLFNYETIL